MEPCGEDCYATVTVKNPNCHCVCKGDMYKQYEQDQVTNCDEKIKADQNGGCLDYDIRSQCCVTCNKMMKDEFVVPPTLQDIDSALNP